MLHAGDGGLPYYSDQMAVRLALVWQREQVWSRLLSAAGIENLEVKQLSDYELNGRQIKNTIRLAQALALNQVCFCCVYHSQL